MKCSIAAIAVLSLVVGCGNSANPPNDGGSGQQDAAWLKDTPRPPFIALNCPKGNAFYCDRLVFSMWLRRPARQLSAWVAGRPVRNLKTGPFGGDGPHRGQRGLVWTGYVQPAGLTDPGGPIEIHAKRNYWTGIPAVRARIKVAAELNDGQMVEEIFPSVKLAAGFG